ncbi:15406_t:CDS:2, partial [Cetraspora pellucida]
GLMKQNEGLFLVSYNLLLEPPLPIFSNKAPGLITQGDCLISYDLSTPDIYNKMSDN